MTNIDQFESVFKSAIKTPFHFLPPPIRSVTVVTDLGAPAAEAFQRQALPWFAHLTPKPELHCIAGEQYQSVSQLLEQIERRDPDLLCTYRYLKTPADDFPYSLGLYLDVMTQATTIPVLVLPHPTAQRTAEADNDSPRRVMAITDHLTGDDRLVNFAAAMTSPGGRLFLTHVEDEQTFSRYANAISKIPTVDTDDAVSAIREQLLKEPREFIQSCATGLRETMPQIQVEAHVTLGHHLRDYKQLISEHRIELLVLNTKDEDQLAMHGLAYPLSVELRETPLLLL